MAWAAADHALPVGDAPGHVMIAARWAHWWHVLPAGTATSPPNEPFPPLVYLGLAWAQIHQGATFDDLQVFMAIAAGGLVAACAWAAARGGGGPAGALVAGLLVLRAPLVIQVDRQFLLDGPATAAVIATLGAVWWSDGFRRPLPSLATGIGIGLVVLTKYSLLIWLAAPMALWALVLVFRTPVALLPIALSAGSLWWWGLQLWALRLHRPTTITMPWPQLRFLAITTTVLLVVATIIPSGRRSAVWRGLRRGTCVALGAHAALTLVVAWLWWGVAAAWQKIDREAINAVWAAGWPKAHAYALYAVEDTVPIAGWVLAAGLCMVVLAWVSDQRRTAARSMRCLVQSLGAAAVGTYLLSRTLPIDPKYYMVIGPLVAIGLSAALGAHRFGRRVLLPAAGLALFGLAVAGQEFSPLAGAEVVYNAVDNGTLWRFPTRWGQAPAPVTDDWEGAARDTVAAITSRWTSKPRHANCEGVVLQVPSLSMVEDRALMAQAALHGVDDNLWARPKTSLPPCGGITLLLVGPPPRLIRNPDTQFTRSLPEGVQTLSSVQASSWARLVAWARPTP
ncbi:MAG: hypothetical protein GXP62_12720 [Oligoflexia bacterium]|nr:hypothetical protein [Oligoflexia bacterium]